MLESKLYEVLKFISNQSYPDIKHNPFYITVENKELKTRNGCWHYPRPDSKSKIVVNNLDRGTKEIIKTLIHELAHNVDYSIRKQTGHDREFYKVYKNLLEVAIESGILTSEDIDGLRDIRILISHHGSLRAQYNPDKSYKKDNYIIKVEKSFKIKDVLSSRGYKYSPIEQVWFKEVSEKELEGEQSFLISIIDQRFIHVSEVRSIEIQAMGYVIAEKCYEKKDLLKNRGYIYKGYNQKGSKNDPNVWVKKLKVSELESELAFLTRNGIGCKTNTIKSKKVK